jgi:hypothetical protein
MKYCNGATCCVCVINRYVKSRQIHSEINYIQLIYYAMAY